MFKYLGIPTTITACVVVHSESNGTVTLDCDGTTYTEIADTSVNDGLVRVDITGLEAGRTYSYTVTNADAETEAGNLKTFPDNRAIKIGYYSCSANTAAVIGILLEEDIDCVVCLGDEIYCDNSDQTLDGETAYGTGTSLANATSSDNYCTFYRIARKSYAKDLIEQIPFAVVHDDHDFGVNDLDWSASIFDATAEWGATTEANRQDWIDASAEATEIYNLGNPANNDSGLDIGAFYYRFTVGQAEIFVISTVVAGRDATQPDRLVRPNCSTLDAGQLGTNQLAWLKASLKASTKPIKIIMSPKQTFQSQFSNYDGWITRAATNELLDILAFIEAGTDWALPGGVVWGCGDYHSPSLHASYNGADTNTLATWKASTAYAENDIIVPVTPTGYYYICTVAGTTGAAEPTFPASLNTTVADNTATWKATGVHTTAYNHVAFTACPSGQDADGVRNAGLPGPHTLQWYNDGTGIGGTTNGNGAYLRCAGVFEVPADGEYVDGHIILGNGHKWVSGRVNAGSNALTDITRKPIISL